MPCIYIVNFYDGFDEGAVRRSFFSTLIRQLNVNDNFLDRNSGHKYIKYTAECIENKIYSILAKRSFLLVCIQKQPCQFFLRNISSFFSRKKFHSMSLIATF